MAVCDEDEMFLQTAFEGYVLPWDRFKRWVTCFCVVTFDLELGQALELVYPTHIELTDREKTNICYLAFPDSNSGCMGDTQFHFRIRCSPRSCQKSQFIRRCEDEVPVAYRSDPAHFYGLAYFRQVKDPSLPRGYFQKSVVLISRLPYVNLFSEVMQFVAPNYFENGELSLEAVCHDIDQWPYPEAGHTLQLPLMGNVLQVRIPSRGDKPGAVSSPDNPLVPQIVPQMPSPKVIPTLKDPDIFRCLQPILPHIHLLWELVLTNEPIVVMAPSPTVCSETVQALASLISPLHYCSDFRPFFTIHDTEFKEYTTRTQAPPGVILGVTNPFFAKTLQHWPHMVRIGEMANLVVTSRRSPVIGHNPKKTLSSKPGIYTKYKQLLAKDKLIFRRLSKGNHPKRPPEVQNAILRRHMVELTQSFMIPLERYVASLMPLQKSISPWKRPPRLRPFDAEEFLTTLEHSGPQLTSRLKGNWVALYREIFKSANFEGWLRQRRQEIRQKLELLHLEALGKADVSLWIKDKQEVEIVDLFLQIKEKLAGSVSFYPPVGHDVKQQLKAHLTTITNNLPVDLQFVLKNS
ncbi:protein DENND6A-like [Acropora millepora]|uniref:protein DENND6A-like n=1 Tax=Acropora millepora TaxID=45264 RepID=UPI001CF25497|nr:protein DENND6A-like [Acropora millepora]